MKKTYTLFMALICSLTILQAVESDPVGYETKQTIEKSALVISGNIIPPGTGTISAYLEQGDYEEYFLINDSIYEELAPIVINRKITLKAKDTVSLPALNNLPIIKNTFGLDAVIVADHGADLKMVGIDIDGQGTATRCISMRTATTNNVVEGIHLNRCRIHGTTGDLIGVWKMDSVTLKSATFTNSFAYDAGEHGLYIKDIYAADGNNDKYVFHDITFWNLGDQFLWIQELTPGSVQDYELDHLTGWNLSTSGYKELIGNSSNGGQYNIQLTNSIFSKQISSTGDGAGSLRFTTENANGPDNSLTLRNLVLYDVMPVLPRDGSDPTPVDNLLEADPAFVDAANGDFTLGNSSYETAGDGGSCVGARYWVPGFVDDYVDLYEPTNTLDSIYIDEEPLPGFYKNKLSYLVPMVEGADIPVVGYVKTDTTCFDTISHATDLNGSIEERTTSIKITSSDLVSTNVYSIEFFIASTDNTLSRLSVNGFTLAPVFSSENTSYTCKVPRGTNSITVIATATNSGASVDGDGTIVLNGLGEMVVVKVTSEFGTTKEYQIQINEESAITSNIIPPGVDNINYYIKNSNYEEYILINNGVYEELEPIVIDRKVTFKAQDTVTLPALDNLPIIKNTNNLDAVIITDHGADLKMIGIDVDGNGTATRCISFRTATNKNIVKGIHLNRCRIHNATGDLIGGWRTDSVTLKSAIFTNSFAYDAGEHGIYVKDVYAEDGNNDKYVFKNITFWNLGDQLIWVKIPTPECVQDWEFDHMTGWNLSTNRYKELIGNTDVGGQYNIQLTNSIFSKQLSSTGDGAGSLRFTTANLYGDDNTFDIRNIVLYETMPIINRDGSGPISFSNVFYNDPAFADPANGDFTIGNTDYLTAGDNGTIIGATYWHPDFVDTYLDLNEDATNISTLDSIAVNGVVIPDFDKTILNYSLILDDSSIPVVTYHKTDTSAQVTVKDATDLLGSKEERTTTLTVNSSDQLSRSVYTIEFNVLSNDATLSSILVNYVELANFSSDKENYQVDLLSKPSSIPVVSYTLNQDSASASVVQATDLDGTVAERTATISVLAENEVDTKVYTILFNVATSSARTIDVPNQWFYPTKVKDRIYLKIDKDYANVSVISLTGNQVLKESISANGTIEIDLSSLASGMYIIKVEGGSSVITGRFIKE